MLTDGTFPQVVGRSRFGIPKHLLTGVSNSWHDVFCAIRPHAAPKDMRSGINLEDDLEDGSDFSSKRGSCFVFPFRWCIC